MADEVVVVTVGVSMALAFLGLVGAYAARYKRVPPGHAMVVFGRRFGDRRYQVIVGGGRFIQPIVESYVLISLEPISIEMLVEDVVGTPDRVRRLQVSLTAIAKVSDDVDLLKVSAEQLIHKGPDEIRKIVERTLEGHTRGVLATEPSPEADLERSSQKIRSKAAGDLASFGIEVRSLFMKIRDSSAISGADSGPMKSANREIHRLDLRVRRIEEKLGLSVSAEGP
ncbi:MAG TPA: flotillin family protein [Thermoplasmata archaeon]|nr:flotillin family protein [Thermoplasmata archaeon]